MDILVGVNYFGVMVNMHNYIYGALCLLVFSGSADANKVERIFAEAAKYTVVVETRIEIPYIEDEPGVFEGAGFVVDAKRQWIMTNAHVASYSKAEITIAFKGEPPRPAHAIYIDPYLDLAILQYEGAPSDPGVAAQLECTDIPGVGHPVGAYGHPEGLKFTGTMGIISGITPKFGPESLQTDAPINHGNSGGPLISLDNGRVMGISAAKLSGEEIENTNFAVVGTYACTVLRLLALGEDPRPVDLGALYFEIDGEPSLTVADSSLNGLPTTLRIGDQIIGANKKRLSRGTEAELLNLLRGDIADTTLLVIRPGVGELSISAGTAKMLDVQGRNGIYIGGALFARTNLLDIEYFASSPGVMIHSVEPGSAASAAGLAYFDHVSNVNGQPVADINDFSSIIDSADGDFVEIELIRVGGGANRFTQHVRAELPTDDLQKFVDEGPAMDKEFFGRAQ
jgi:S1-C subfamily serine protease